MIPLTLPKIPKVGGTKYLAIGGAAIVSSMLLVNKIDSSTWETQKPTQCEKSQVAVEVPKTHIQGVPSFLLFTNRATEMPLRDWIAEKYPDVAIGAVVKANSKLDLSNMGTLPATYGGILCLTLPVKIALSSSPVSSAPTITPSTKPSVNGTPKPSATTAAEQGTVVSLPKVPSRLPATLSDKQIVALAYGAGFRGNALRQISAIALAESGGKTNAICRNTGHGCGAAPGTEISSDVGIFQINLKAHGVTMADALDPGKNAALAWKISNHGKNFGPWMAHMHASDVKFIPRIAKAMIELKLAK